MTPAAAETLHKIRSRADGALALLLVAHFPMFTVDLPQPA